MYCSNCGGEINLSDQKCQQCGKVTNNGPSQLDEGNILKSSDGTYRWVYEMSMSKNPTIFFTVWKVLVLCGAAPAILMFFLTLENGLGEALLIFLQIMGIVAGIMTMLLLIAYPIVMIINGGKYCVVFEMDTIGVNHIQLQKQFKKQQTFAMITVLAGIIAGNIQATGAGLLAGSKQSLYSKFSSVKTIIVHRKRHVIYVNGNLVHNQIYAEKKDFDTVLNHIIKYAPKAKIIYK